MHTKRILCNLKCRPLRAALWWPPLVAAGTGGSMRAQQHNSQLVRALWVCVFVCVRARRQRIQRAPSQPFTRPIHVQWPILCCHICPLPPPTPPVPVILYSACHRGWARMRGTLSVSLTHMGAHGRNTNRALPPPTTAATVAGPKTRHQPARLPAAFATNAKCAKSVAHSRRRRRRHGATWRV